MALECNLKQHIQNWLVRGSVNGHFGHSLRKYLAYANLCLLLFAIIVTGLQAGLLSVNMYEFPLLLTCMNQITKTVEPAALFSLQTICSITHLNAVLTLVVG